LYALSGDRVPCTHKFPSAALHFTAVATAVAAAAALLSLLLLLLLCTALASLYGLVDM